MLRIALLVVAGLGGLALTAAGGVLASMFIGSVSDSDRTIGYAMVGGLVAWAGLHVLGWRLSGSEGHATAGMVVLGVVTALDVLGVVGLLGAISVAARP